MAAPTNFQLLSPSFQHNGEIPTKFTRQGSDISPALAWTQASPKTQSFALIMEDPDASVVPFVHWLIYDLPVGTLGLPEGVTSAPQLPNGARQGRNDFDKVQYSGPCPPRGSAHRYVFTLYALNTRLGLDPGATRTKLENAMKGHILKKTELHGRFQLDSVPTGSGTVKSSHNASLQPAKRNPANGQRNRAGFALSKRTRSMLTKPIAYKGI
jgi:Raf kinase inhibitor-like YbhB/YbcL family protein